MRAQLIQRGKHALLAGPQDHDLAGVAANVAGFQIEDSDVLGAQVIDRHDGTSSVGRQGDATPGGDAPGEMSASRPPAS